MKSFSCVGATPQQQPRVSFGRIGLVELPGRLSPRSGPRAAPPMPVPTTIMRRSTTPTPHPNTKRTAYPAGLCLQQEHWERLQGPERSGTLDLDDFSAGVWIKGLQDDAQDWAGYWAMGTDSGGDIRLIANNSNPPRACRGGDDSNGIWAYTWDTTATKMETGVWKHVFFSSTGGKAKIYLNGVFQESKDMQDSSTGPKSCSETQGCQCSRRGQDEMTFHKIARMSDGSMRLTKAKFPEILSSIWRIWPAPTSMTRRLKSSPRKCRHDGLHANRPGRGNHRLHGRRIAT